MKSNPQFRLKPPKLKLSENDVKKACLDLLRLRQWWPIRQHVGLFRTVDQRKIQIGVTGDPDYVVIKAPSFFLELKKPGGKLSDDQRARIKTLKQFYGLDTVVVEGVEELIEWLDRHKHSP
jgi:hypothetical protein